jgi:hypothetical protein
MKEIFAPHNDWITPANPLFLGKLRRRPGKDERDPAHVADALFAKVADVADFAALVKKGITRLVEARAEKNGDGQSLKQRLRPLFTTMEMNLVHDRAPYARRVAKREAVEVPAEFFVDTRLTGPVPPVAVPVAVYEQALKKLGSSYAAGETPGLVESYHAFSAPARSFMDNEVVRVLTAKGLLDDDLVSAVLAVDFTTPVYSKARAGLLKYVPAEAKDAKALRAGLVANLKKAKGGAAERELLANLTEPGRGREHHKKRALAYLAAARKAAGTPAAVEGWLRLRLQRRAEVIASQPAKLTTGGMVLEEDGSDFKVVFPRFTRAPAPKPGQLRLSPKTGTVE